MSERQAGPSSSVAVPVAIIVAVFVVCLGLLTIVHSYFVIARSSGFLDSTPPVLRFNGTEAMRGGLLMIGGALVLLIAAGVGRRPS